VISWSCAGRLASVVETWDASSVISCCYVRCDQAHCAKCPMSMSLSVAHNCIASNAPCTQVQEEAFQTMTETSVGCSHSVNRSGEISYTCSASVACYRKVCGKWVQHFQYLLSCLLAEVRQLCFINCLLVKLWVVREKCCQCRQSTIN